MRRMKIHVQDADWDTIDSFAQENALVTWEVRQENGDRDRYECMLGELLALMEEKLEKDAKDYK